MATIDAAIQEVVSHLLPLITNHKQNQTTPNSSPFILGLTGLQGSGKSTWASKLSTTLNTTSSLKTIVLSLDDLYLPHSQLIALRHQNPSNKLLRTRGQPGSHDVALARSFFEAVRTGETPLKLPRFDKSRFEGEGDRVPIEEWEKINVSTGKGMDVLIFEGWCVGFQPLSTSELKAKWETACAERQRRKNDSLSGQEADGDESCSITTLADHSLDSLLTINGNLREYCEIFMGPQCFDTFIHLDTEDLRNVYRWRIEQEHALIKAKGEGMSDESVVAFVRGYMPSYELYLDQLRRGFFEGEEKGKKTHLRVVLGVTRRIASIATI
ncbi:P-loop containing nucleoside triphosphate hydrolase protein [Venturia nashicola]|nr:P-loop containing nucleoside triphosphate hydrolase protein [Venturia nashicola]